MSAPALMRTRAAVEIIIYGHYHHLRFDGAGAFSPEADMVAVDMF